MIYEIQLRAAALNKPSSDHLIRIESSLPTRAFEQWMIRRNLLSNSPAAAVVRWRIVQTNYPAHFVLDSNEQALVNRIAALISPALTVKQIPMAAKVQRNVDLNGYALAA
jgi:hypothetical protein